MKKVKNKRAITLTAGLLTALVVVISQLFYFQVQETTVKKEVKTAAHQDEGSAPSEEAFITMPSSTLPSSNHIEVHEETFILIEILFKEEPSSVSVEVIAKPVSQWLFTLFRTAISPNAP